MLLKCCLLSTEIERNEGGCSNRESLEMEMEMTINLDHRRFTNIPPEITLLVSCCTCESVILRYVGVEEKSDRLKENFIQALM